MSDRPLISVITPVLNGARTLERTIRSVLDQRYPRLEYLVIDGGSSDGTLSILKQYETRLAGWVSEPDRGIADAFNKGVRRSTGELIGIVNADDYYEPGALERAADAYSASGPDTVLHGDLRYYDARSSRVVRPWPAPRVTLHLDLPFNHPTYFVPRAVYEKVGLYDPAYRIAMDFDWTLRAVRAGVRFKYLPGVLTHFEVGGTASSNARKCHGEVLRSQLAHGLNPWVCRLAHAAKMTINRSKTPSRWAAPAAG